MTNPEFDFGETTSEQTYIDGVVGGIKNAAEEASNRKTHDPLTNEFNEKGKIVEAAIRELDAQARQKGEAAKDSLIEGQAGFAGQETTLKHRVVTAAALVRSLLKEYQDTHPNLINLLPDSVGKTLISKIKDKVSISEVDLKTAPYLYTLIYQAINGQINNFNDLEEAYQKIQHLNIYNRPLFDKLTDIFREIAISLGEDQEKVKKIFRKEEEKAPITGEEERRFLELRKEFMGKLTQKRSQLTPEEYKKVISFLTFGRVKDKNNQHFNSALTTLGISQDEVEEFSRLASKISERVIDLGWIRNYTGGYAEFLIQAMKDFSVERIESFFSEVDQNGNRRFVFNKKNAYLFKQRVDEYYFRALRSIHSKHQKDFQSAFQEDSAASYYFLGLAQIIDSNIEKILIRLRLPPSLASLTSQHPEISDLEKIRSFLEDVSYRYQGNIRFFSEIMHNFPLWARDPESQEKWASFLRHIFPSQLAEMFDDDGFMSLVRRTIPFIIRRELVKNNNFYPSDLLGGVYKSDNTVWTLRFKKMIEDEVLKLAEKYGYDLGIDDRWRLQRALTYAEALGIITLIDIETMGTSYPQPNNFKGIHPLLPKLFARFNWRIGRGFPAAGMISKWLLGMKVELFPEERPLYKRLWKKKEWVPEKIADEIDIFLKQTTEELAESFLIKDASFLELLNMVNIPASYISRGGWRISPLWEKLKELKEIKKIFKNFESRYNCDFEKGYRKAKEYSKERTARDGEITVRNAWKKIWQLSLLKYGNASLWWFITGGPDRLGFDLKSIVARDKGGDDLERYFVEDYALGSWQPTNETLTEEFNFVDFDGITRKKSLFEIKNIRLNQIRGEAFFYYLQRNPGELFLIISQMVPELAAGLTEDGTDTGFVFLTENERAHNREYKKLDKKGREMVERREKELISRWGEDNFRILIQLRKWVIDNAKSISGGKIKEFIDTLTSESLVAFQGLYERIKTITDVNSLTENQLKDYLKVKREDFRTDGDGQRIAEAILGENGLIRILTGLPPDNLDSYLDNFGDFDQAGRENFFYRLANNWMILEGDVNPFASDVNHYEAFASIGAVGEDMISRFQGDVDFVFKELIKNLGDLERILARAARSGSLEEIYKFHEHLYIALSSTISSEYAHRANYILATIVAKFFMEHNLARDVRFKYLFPMNLIFKMSLGKKLSLSKFLLNDYHAWSWDDNALRTYFMALSHGYGGLSFPVIPEKGAWSEELLNRAFETTNIEFFIGDVIPTVGWGLALFIILMAIKKALEETEGKK